MYVCKYAHELMAFYTPALESYIFSVFTMLEETYKLNSIETALTTGLIQSAAFPQNLNSPGNSLGNLFVSESAEWMTATLLSQPSRLIGSISLQGKNFSTEIYTPVSVKPGGRQVIMISAPDKAMLHAAFQIHLEGDWH